MVRAQEDGPANIGQSGARALLASEAAMGVLTEEEIQQLQADVATITDDSFDNISTMQEMRSVLLEARARAIDSQSQGQSEIRELEARLAALGPAPEEGFAEPEEIAARREVLVRQLGQARVPILQAQEAEARLELLLETLDRKLIQEFSENLVTRGPSPLFPIYWRDAVSEIREVGQTQMTAIRELMADREVRTAAADQLPARLFLILVAVGLTFHLRSKLGDWIETSLETAERQRTVAWILALRNLNRIILPTVGVGLLFAALRPEVWMTAQPQASYFGVPVAIWYLIGANWLAGSLFAPRTANHRILPLDNVEARSGARITNYIGILLALDTLLRDLIAAGGLSPSTQAVLYLPLICMASAQLIGMASLMRLLHRRIRDRMTTGAEAQSVGLGLRAIDVFAGVIRLAAFIAPVLAAAGFLAAARLLEFPVMTTVALLGAALVVFDLLSKTAVSIFVGPSKPRAASVEREGGLIPIFVAAFVCVACLPLLLLIWGARPVDLIEGVRLLADGASVGGVAFSPASVLKFLIVFALVMAVLRLLQILLRGTILPRTRLDAGGKNAITAGVNYLGFAFAGILSVSAAGFDLTNLAIVAGALSVGIGFGLQTVVSNFVSGIILLIERPIKEGDWIEVGQYTGYVQGIRVRSTVIETFDKAAVIVPNADLVANTVLNRTHSHIVGRVIVPVHVSYDTDPRKVEEILMELAERHPLVVDDPSPAALFMGFGPDGLNFELRCFLRDVNFLLTVKSDMNFDIAERFRAQGIQIPLPQRDLHLRSAAGLEDVMDPARGAAQRPAVSLSSDDPGEPRRES